MVHLKSYVKISVINLSMLLFAAGLLNFMLPTQIDNCYLTFDKAKDLTMALPERLPETDEKIREITTDKGDVVVSRIDGYRILYNNKKESPFVNLKIELSKHSLYHSDTLKIIENLRHLNSNSANMESKDLIRIVQNGYNIYGLSRNSVEKGSTLGTFVMFPGNDVTVYFYFNNLNPEVRNFESLEDYKLQRDSFFEGYTNHIKGCIK